MNALRERGYIEESVGVKNWNIPHPGSINHAVASLFARTAEDVLKLVPARTFSRKKVGKTYGGEASVVLNMYGYGKKKQSAYFTVAFSYDRDGGARAVVTWGIGEDNGKNSFYVSNGRKTGRMAVQIGAYITRIYDDVGSTDRLR